MGAASFGPGDLLITPDGGKTWLKVQCNEFELEKESGALTTVPETIGLSDISGSTGTLVCLSPPSKKQIARLIEELTPSVVLPYVEPKKKTAQWKQSPLRRLER